MLRKRMTKVWRFVAKKPVEIGLVSVCCVLTTAVAKLVATKRIFRHNRSDSQWLAWLYSCIPEVVLPAS